MTRKLTEVAHQPYVHSTAHLNDHLQRIDLLVRAQVERWFITMAADKPETMWGMLHVYIYSFWKFRMFLTMA